MNILAEHEGRVYWAIAVNVPGVFVCPFPGSVFPCMIWDHNGRFTAAERAVLATGLLEAGCRYAVCGGRDCEAWEHSVDLEFVRQHGDQPDEAVDAVFVMTSSHVGESPDEVARSFVLDTNFDYHDFKRYLVLHVGDGPAKTEVDEAVRRFALSRESV